MRTKGISPIVASVLVILVVVSLASTYTIWASRLFGQTTEETEETVTSTTKQLFSAFDIQGAKDQQVFIKNTGTAELSASALQVFYDSEPIEFSADFDILQKNGLGTLTLRSLWKFGRGDHTLRITAGPFADSAKVTASPARGAVGDWRFEEGSGTTARDSSGGSNDGTITQATYTDGKVGKALNFDGVNDRVSFGNDADLKLQPPLTVEAWVKKIDDGRDPTASAYAIVFGAGGGNAINFGVYNKNVQGIGKALYAHVVESDINSGTSIKLESAQDVPKNVWVHILAYQTATESRLYVDGKLAASGRGNGTITYDTNPVMISEHPGNANLAHFYGMIDEVRLYGKALTPEETVVITLKS